MTGLRLGARLWWGAVPLVLLLWGTGALLVATLPGLPEPGLLASVAAPAVGFARDVALAVTAGAVVVRVLVDAPRAGRWALGWGALSLGLVALSLPALLADVTAGQDGVDLGNLVQESAPGRALVGQGLALLIGLALVAVPRRWARVGALVAVLVAVSLPPMSGHAGLSGPHGAAAVAIGLHAASASVWVGGLAVVSVLVLLERETAGVLLPRFSVLALVCVIVAAEAGLLSASLLLESLSDLLGTAYGSIVLAKAVLLAWLAWLGWQQRRRAIDRLPDSSVPVTVASIATVELTVMGVAIGCAVALSRIGPSPVPGSGFAPLALVALGLGIPMLVVAIRPRGWAVSDNLPEAAAVVLLVAIIEVGGVGLLTRLLGPVGLVLEGVLLVLAGWLAVSAARRHTGGLVTLALGLPIALLLAARLADRPEGLRMAVVAVVTAESLIGAAWWLQRRTDRGAGRALASVAG